MFHKDAESRHRLQYRQMQVNPDPGHIIQRERNPDPGHDIQKDMNPDPGHDIPTKGNES